MESKNIILVIFIAGIFGGAVNYLRKKDEKKAFKWPDFLKAIIFGVVAAALIPLFLELTESNILKEDSFNKLMVFLGFCLIAAISSSEFIDSITKRLLSKIDKLQNEIESVNTEDDQVEEIVINQIADNSELRQAILNTFIQSKFTYRSVSGISKQAGFNQAETKMELSRLQKEGLVKAVQRLKGLRFQLTSNGFIQAK